MVGLAGEREWRRVAGRASAAECDGVNDQRVSEQVELLAAVLVGVAVRADPGQLHEVELADADGAAAGKWG